jgi:hypothetical protein
MRRKGGCIAVREWLGIGTTYGLLGNGRGRRGSIHGLLLLGSVDGGHFGYLGWRQLMET